MLNILLWLLALLILIIAIPLAEMVYASMHKARREGNSAGLKALTTVFYTKPPTIVYEIESRQAREEYDKMKNLDEVSSEEDSLD